MPAMVLESDVAIVGAGIVGCMVAAETARRHPGAACVLLDRDMLGSGATRRSAGLHIPAGATPRIRAMSLSSQDHYQRLARSDPSLPIHPVAMTVVAAESGAERLAATFPGRAGLTRTGHVGGGAVRIPPGAAAWTVQGCQYADVYALTQALGRALRPRVTVREGVNVTGVHPAGDRVALRLGNGDTLHAGRVVLAPGPWAGAFGPPGVRVKKIVALHVDRPVDDGDEAVFFPDEDAFLLPLAHRGHWLFSYTCREWDVDPDRLTDGISPRHLAEARACLDRYAPGLGERCRSGRVFCDAYSGDGEPLVRALDDAGRIVFAGAAGGSGYRLAPAIAAEAADLLDLPALPPHRPSTVRSQS
jgi:glycine/D-amino acid oxidase-like deaminating enzyme